MAYTAAWDETFPPDTQPANLLGDDLRDFKRDVRERVASFGAGIVGDRPTPEAVFVGVMYYATDEDKLYRWNGASWDLIKDLVSTVSNIVSVGGVFIDALGARNIPIWRAPFACTVTNVRGYRVGGTGATINARRNGTDNHLAAALSLTSADAWMDGGAVQNTAYVTGDKLEIMLVSITGSPTEIPIQVDFTKV